MKATPWNQKTIDEFQTKQGRGVGIWGDHVLLMTAKGAKSGDAITTPLVYGRDGLCGLRKETDRLIPVVILRRQP